MGYAIAEAALARGADVTLVSGPVALAAPAKAEVVSVRSAGDMHREMTKRSGCADVIIMCAAVADYTPKTVCPEKIKKSGDMTIELERTKDILKELGQSKKQGQVLIGFAAETNDPEENAVAKLSSKNLDIIALNDVAREGEGFGSDENNIKLFYKDGSQKDLGSGNKKALAKEIINSIFEYRKNILR